MKKKNEENLRPMHHEGHRLKTRRDFMAQGFLGMTAFALAPSVLSMLSQNAHAQTGCAPLASVGLTPIIIIDLAGGGNIGGSNVMVGGQGGQLDFLPNYSSLGLPPDMHPSRSGQINNDLGLTFHSGSGILRGIVDATDASTRNNCEGAVFCTSSDDDTSNNQHNPIYWLNRAGAKGQLTQLAGTSQSEAGGNSKAPTASLNPAVAPVRISSNRDALNLVSLGARLNTYTPGKVEKILNAASRMSQNKINSISRRSLPDQLRALVGCGFSEASTQVNSFSPQAIDPSRDTVLTAVMGRITNEGIRNKTAPITRMVVEGFVGVGTIVLGGYDYHDGSRATGERKDRELGQVIGAIMEYAARRQKDVVVYVLTDGGVSTNSTADNSADGGGKFIWTGDSGQRSSTFMMVYKRDGRPALRNTNRRQVGHFKTSGSVENSALLTSNSVVNLSKAVVANYLALHGIEGQLESVVGDDPFRNQLDNYLVFDKLR